MPKTMALGFPGANPTKQFPHVLGCPSQQVKVSGNKSVTDLCIQYLTGKLPCNPCNANGMTHGVTRFTEPPRVRIARFSLQPPFGPRNLLIRAVLAGP